MVIPIGFIGPLKKENEALRKEIQNLRLEITSLKAKLEGLQPQALNFEKVLANLKDVKQAEARSFRSSGNSDAAMLSGR